MEQVLENLLVEALRYVPSGGTIEVALEPAASGGCHRISIFDDGPGIPDAELPFVFERFYRGASRSGTREEDGSDWDFRSCVRSWNVTAVG